MKTRSTWNMVREAWLLLAVFLGNGNTWAAEAPLRVLILSGQNNHDWRQTTPKLKSILTVSGRFTVDVTEHPEQCGADAFSPYDVLLSDWNTFGNSRVKSWPDPTRTALLDFVRGGRGFVVVHAGGCSFYEWPEYQQLAGAFWQMGQTSHGSPHEFTVKPLDGHPITRGMKPFQTTDELWMRPGVGSLSHTLTVGDGGNLPPRGRRRADARGSAEGCSARPSSTAGGVELGGWIGGAGGCPCRVEERRGRSAAGRGASLGKLARRRSVG